MDILIQFASVVVNRNLGKNSSRYKVGIREEVQISSDTRRCVEW